jgi:hypothetical protein
MITRFCMINNCLKTLSLSVMASLLALAWAVDQAVITLGQPISLALYQDGGRFLYRFAVPLGTTHLVLPADIGTIVQVDGADSWHEQHRADSQKDLPLPAHLPAYLEALQGLSERQAILQEREQLAQRLSYDIAERLPLRALDAVPDNTAWQASLEALVLLRQTNAL